MFKNLIRKLKRGSFSNGNYQLKLDGARHILLAVNDQNITGDIDISGLKNAVVLDTRYLLENYTEIIHKLRAAYPEA